jgi:hypothetical protein
MRPLLVFEDSLQQIAGHADVKSVAAARNDVRAIDVFLHWVNLRWLVDEEQPQVLRLRSG